MGEAEGYGNSYYFTTNWNVVSGSLESSITFESSLSEIAEDAASPSCASPLFLSPPPSDSGPCEIKIIFAHKHELRQIYVRSTARTYEVYYGSKQRECDEYLCTVRCGIATRDNEVLHTDIIMEAGKSDQTEATRSLNETMLRTAVTVGGNEDDWAEVKANNASGLSDGRKSTASNISLEAERSIQDLYEATAEINDVDPCISLTLRLLSLQEKGCILVDEIYVFADPVVPFDQDQDVGTSGGSATNSIMAMLIPSLLQFSKTRDASNEKEKHRTTESGKNSLEDIEATSSTFEEFKYGSKKGIVVENTEKQTTQQMNSTEGQADTTSRHNENVLEHLVSRVSHIEKMLVRFESSMLKPITSIEERLQQVELKLEKLIDKPQNSSFLACSRIVAPEFSCDESDPLATISAEVKAANSVTSEYTDGDSSKPNSGADMIDPDSTADAESIYLQVNGELQKEGSEEENQSLGRICSEGESKRSVSINDALAYALAGFMSFAEDHKYTQALAIKAPEFANEDDAYIEKKPNVDEPAKASTMPAFDEDINSTSVSSRKENEMLSHNHCIAAPVGNKANDPSIYYPVRNEAKVLENIERCTGSRGDTHDGICERNVTGSCNSIFSVQLRNQAADSVKVPGNGESNCDKLNNVLHVETNTSDGKSCDAVDALVNTIQNDAHASVQDTSTDAYSSKNFVLPSGVPPLDVQFNSYENSCEMSSVDVFLGVTVHDRTSTAKPDHNIAANQSNLISIEEDEKLIGPPTDTLSSVDVDYIDFTDTCQKMEDGIHHGSGVSKCDEIIGSGLI